jgi:hypothetical protein
MAQSDWNLGQDLIERGFCTLDQVREALSIQDRMKSMGIIPKTLPEVLLEKGYVTPDQLQTAGIRVQAPVAPKSAPPRPPRPAVKRRSPAPWFALVAAVAVIAAVAFFGGDILKVFSGPARPEAARRPESPSGPTEIERADQAAREDLDRIGAFALAANDFENAKEVAARYDDYMRRHAGQKWELEGNRRLQEYRGKAEAFARPRLEEILKEESLLRDQGRLGELLRRFRAFPAPFLEVTEAGRIVRERITELANRQKEEYLHGKADAEKLLRDRKFEAALDRATALKLSASDDEKILQEVADLQTRIEFEYRTATQKVREELSDAYFKVDGAFKEFLSRRPSDPRRAASAVAEFLWASWPEEKRPFLRVRGVDYDLLRKTLDDWKPEAVVAICDPGVPEVESSEKLSTAESALLDLRSACLVALFYRDLDRSYLKAVEGREPLDLPVLGKGHFERREGRTVYAADGKGVIDQPLAEADLGAIAMRAGPLDAAMHARLGFYYYYGAPAEYPRAYAHLLKAREKVRGLGPYLADLAAVAQTELSRALRVKFETGEDLYKKGQKGPAKQVLEEMLEHADHPFVKDKRAAIEKILFQIAEGTEKERLLALAFRGRGQALEDGRARVTYDFSDKSQLEAFEFVEEEASRKFKGRWKLDRGALESSNEASVMRWKSPVKGDVVLEYDLAVLEDPQNIVVDLYYTKGQSRHYAVVLGFDWVGKADGDLKNTKEDEYGMPRTCVIKYPVAVDKSRWVLAAEWENWKSRLVGRGKGVWKPLKGKSYRMQVARLGTSIRLTADKEVVWEGEDGAYSEGQVVFFSDSRCRIGNLSITFRPE